MGRIASSVGLITGTDIVGTVDQLIALSARPRDRLLLRINTLQQQQQAYAELTASVIGVQLSGDQLSSTSLFRSKKADSSNTDALSVVTTETSAVAEHLVRTLQTAATHSVNSQQRFDAANEALGLAGSISINPDGFVDDSIPLRSLNNGRGIDLGTIRITDRSGKSSDIDLSSARTFEDVLTKINDAKIDVQATTDGDAIKLIDQTGLTDSNLIVEQLGNRETAADLGLWGIDEPSSSVTGLSLQSPVSASTKLSDLRNDQGIRFATGDDLVITLSDGTSLDVDFGDFSGAGADATLNDVVNALNSLDPLKVSASFTAGELVVNDLTGGTGSFEITDAKDAFAASDLGLTGSTTSSSITASYENKALRGASLASLGGGNGLGTLTNLDITLADGSSASVDLSSASNTNEVLDAINASGLSLIATLNDAGNGFRIRDVSGGTGTLEISSADETAANLGLQASSDDPIVVGGNLARQTVDESTLLADLNQGVGVSGGSFTITDSSGSTSAINITTDKITTVGELIDKLNGLSIGIAASLNETGDGIAVVDTAGGSLTLKISNTGTGTAASDLGIAGTATSQTFGGSTVSALIGTQADVFEIEADDTLEDIVNSINEDGRYGTASVVTNDDGTYSLNIRSKAGGEAGRLGINTSGIDLSLRTENRGRDAIITVSTDGGTNRFLTSSDGVFDDEVTGLNLTLKELSEDPVRVNVTENPEAVTKAAQSFVDQYNNLVEKLDSLTFFNSDTNEVGLLFGTSEALRIETGYSRLLSGIIRTGSTVGAGSSIRSLGEIGIRFNDQGKLSLDKSKLESAVSSNAEAVEKLFINVDEKTKVDSGLGKKLSNLADRLAGSDGGLLLNRGNTISEQIERSSDRVNTFNTRLDAERERLLAQFVATEEAIAKIQSNQSFIGQIQPITIPS